jgi:hypothetical protein
MHRRSALADASGAVLEDPMQHQQVAAIHDDVAGVDVPQVVGPDRRDCPQAVVLRGVEAGG